MRHALPILLGIVLLAFSQGQGVPAANGFVPKEGFVPNSAVAVQIAEVVLTPVYGHDMVMSERPYTATLEEGTWVVIGTVPCVPRGTVCPGGAGEVWISKSDGRIMYMTHLQ